MTELEDYKGKEQTYLKHYVLENYLEKLCYIIGSSWDKQICYIDCFSGPWRSETENYKDTSIGISLKVLKEVKKGLLESQNKRVNFKAIYIEKNKQAFNELENILEKENTIETAAINDKFENAVDQILDEVGDSFSLFFIDPIGWKGYGFNEINSILTHQPSELIINFMFDSINRFIETDKEEENFNKLFGGTEWKEDLNLDQTTDREKSIVNYYKSLLKEKADWNYVTNSIIPYPEKDKTYFHLLYATRHIKGLKKYKKIDYNLLDEQVKARTKAQNGIQQSLFSDDNGLKDPYIAEVKKENVKSIKNDLIGFIKENKTIKYTEILDWALEKEMVHENDIRNFILNLQNQNKVKISDWSNRRSKIYDKDTIKYLG